MKLNVVVMLAFELNDRFELLLILVLLTKGGRVPLVAGGADPDPDELPDPLLPEDPLDPLLDEDDAPEFGA